MVYLFGMMYNKTDKIQNAIDIFVLKIYTDSKATVFSGISFWTRFKCLCCFAFIKANAPSCGMLQLWQQDGKEHSSGALYRNFIVGGELSDIGLNTVKQKIRIKKGGSKCLQTNLAGPEMSMQE